MTTITLQYDSQNSVIQHLIEALLAAGATMQTNESTSEHTITPSLRRKINNARQESAKGETIMCCSPEDMQQYFDRL